MEHPKTSRGRVRWAVAAVLALALGLRLAAAFQANVHWDEFGLLFLADRTEATGVLHTGGRPGLAVALLQPFVAQCDDEISVIRRARLLWVAFTALWLAGFAVWIAQLAPDRRRWRDAALGTALVALVPTVLDASLQVRTDHIALVGGSWGGALLLASRRRPLLALAAGVCLGIGFLGSQKVIYLVALAGLLATGQLALSRELQLRREALRLALMAAGGLAVLKGFPLWAGFAYEVSEVSHVTKPMDTSLVEHSFSIFAFYRNTIGWSQYAELLPTLVPHLLLLGALAVASGLAWRRRREDLPRLGLAWAVLALGLGVGLFHAAAFSYFWMTLGLFPAMAFAIAWAPLERLVPEPHRHLAVAGVWALVAVPGMLHMGFQLRDEQAVQRQSLDFVHRNFPRAADGFHPESGLFCQQEKRPFPTYYSQHIYYHFAGENRESGSAKLERQFRERPVQFLVQSWRLNQFPAELRRFWAEHYQPYRASVFVAGRRLEGNRGDESDVELLVSGRYRWLPFTGPQSLAIEDELVAPGGIVQLESGFHAVRFVEDVPGGILVLALEEPPGEAPLAFYQ